MTLAERLFLSTSECKVNSIAISNVILVYSKFSCILHLKYLILGDLKVGDGDPSLTMYGEDITPNEHKLALQFGVLDNFYDSGEVSGDGHLWSTAAITSDYNEKTWQIAYRGKERTYDFQGQVADEYPLEHNQPDVDDPSTGFLWDNLARNHVSFRDYGEFVNAEWCNEKRKVASPRQGTPSGQETNCPKTVVKQGEMLAPNVGDPHAGAEPVALAGASVQWSEANQGGSARPFRSAVSRFQYGLSRSTSRRRIHERICRFRSRPRCARGPGTRDAGIRAALPAGRSHGRYASQFSASGGLRRR